MLYDLARLGTLAATCALTACAVGPNYRPEAPYISRAFMGADAVASRSAPTSADMLEWWKGFNDPVLDQLVSQALGSNLDLAVAAARLEQARAGLRGADAMLLPAAALSGSAAAVHQSLDTPTGRIASASPGFRRDAELYEGNLTAAWEIDIFGGLHRGQEAAHADYDAAQAGTIAARLAVIAQTADTYILARGLQARLAIANDQAQTQRQLLDIIRLQYLKGVAAEQQVRQAEGVLSQVEAGIPVLRNGLDAAMNALDVLAGAQPGTWRPLLSAPGDVPAAPAISNMGTPAELLQRRPDLIVAERKLASANARIGVAMSEYFPKFSLSGLVGTASLTASNVFASGAAQSQGVLGLRWRLFDFGRIDAEIKAAKGARAEALASYRLAVLHASEDVENSFSALLNREAQERKLAQGERALLRVQATSQAAYKAGVVSLIEVLDADARLLSTRDTRAIARTETSRAAVAAFRALGGGWTPGNSTLALTKSPNGKE